MRQSDGRRRSRYVHRTAFLLIAVLAFVVGQLSGCGDGGYPGGGVVRLSATSITIDAGQSVEVSAETMKNAPATWTLAGENCSGNACGTVAPTTDGTAVIYTAPASVTTPLKVQLTASANDSRLTQTANITVNPAPTIAGIPPSGVEGTSYSFVLNASGGTGALTLSVSGNLPPGITYDSASKTLTGTPTTAGSYVFTATLKDQSDVPNTISKQLTIVIGTSGTPLSVVSSALPAATVGVPYSTVLQAVGGTTPYQWSVVTGSLPAGLTLDAATGVISGTPTTQGAQTFTAQVKDASNATATGAFSITVSSAPSTLTLTTGSLPSGTVGVPYTATIGVSGGTAPYTCTITAGTLPAGLSLVGCTVNGTPTVAGTSNLTVKVTDSSNPQGTTSGPVSITIAPVSSPLTLTVTTLPKGKVNIPYSAIIGVSGGTAPYSCAITAGTLQAGLTLNGCTVSGTPTAAGTANLTVKVTDSSNPAATTTGPVSLTIDPASLAITITVLPNGTVGVPYTGTIGVVGGYPPYTCQIIIGTPLPAGLSLSGCDITGTPTTAGTTLLTVKATDAASDTTVGVVSLTILPGSGGTITIASPPPATVNQPYTGTITATGGTGPYTCALAGGTLPAGLTMSNACVVSGTPTTPGATTVSVTVTDSSSPAKTQTGPVTITVNNGSSSPLTFTGTVPNAVVNQPYTHTLTATGGASPYTYAITAGALPAGLSLDSSTGTISGTPTKVAASSFTVTATDSSSPVQTADLPLVMQVTYDTTPDDGKLKGPYAFLVQGYDDVALGLLAYQTASAGSLTADGAGLISAGEMDSNHQSSNPSGNTISSTKFLGAYTIGTDNRGQLTITNLNDDGTTADTQTYAITLKAPVAPETVSKQVSMIRFDGDGLVGTRGSGTMLAQTASSFTAGVSGSYAFGMSGDTPCLPSCTIGLIAGPAAAVGEFTAASGNITAGQGDVNIASTKYAKNTLTGTVGAADSNGRIAFNLQTGGAPSGTYPTDYAVYMVDANNAFVLSTDKHSSYVLLAGSMQKKTQTTFSNTSMSGAFIGYENALADPGVLSGTLSNVLNLSTATIFRGTSLGNGDCTITHVDTGGVNSLVSSLTGILGSLTGLTDLLGSYAHTGTAGCTVASNGRGVLQYPRETLLGLPIGTAPDPRVFYLSAPGTGYFLETGYAGIGRLQQQTGAPFSQATLSGTYVYGTTPAASLASINSTGTFTADGAGHATTTQDLNVGVGNLNVLQLGIPGTATYTLTDANAGRYLMNGTVVIYAIDATHFVTLDTNVLTTSPSVSTLY